MPNPLSVLRMAQKAAKAQEAVDPLAAAIATRMSNQLESLSPLMGLSKQNLPAAYAGDQRSMQAVQRALTAQENGGLESPGRRKMLKQGAAAAARAAVPDMGMGSILANTILGDSPLSLEASSQVLKNLPKSTDWSSHLDSMVGGNLGDELYDTGGEEVWPQVMKHILEKLTPAEHQPLLESTFKKLQGEGYDMDWGQYLMEGQLGTILRGKRPRGMYADDWEDILPYKDQFPVQFSPEEIKAVKHLEKKMPFYGENMNGWELPEQLPSDYKEFQEWFDMMYDTNNPK